MPPLGEREAWQRRASGLAESNQQKYRVMNTADALKSIASDLELPRSPQVLQMPRQFVAEVPTPTPG